MPPPFSFALVYACPLEPVAGGDMNLVSSGPIWRQSRGSRDGQFKFSFCHTQERTEAGNKGRRQFCGYVHKAHGRGRIFSRRKSDPAIWIRFVLSTIVSPLAALPLSPQDSRSLDTQLADQSHDQSQEHTQTLALAQSPILASRECGH